MRRLRRNAMRLSIRARVAGTFAVVMLVLLGVAGALLYVGLDSTLRAGIDSSLRTRASDVGALAATVTEDDERSSPLTERGETVAQILDASGRVRDAPPRLRRAPLLDRGQVERARTGSFFFERPPVVPVDDDDVLRVLARPVRTANGLFIVVVGTSLDPIEAADHRLAAYLLVGGPIILLLVMASGYAAVAGALRPMERLRREAALVGTGGSTGRVSVPPSEDEVHRLAVTLNEMLARNDEAFRRERAFVDDASHEMRTPIALIKAELELAMRPGASIQDLRAAVASAAEENDRLVRLAEDLLVLARADAPPTSAAGDEVDLGAVVHRAVERVPHPGVEVRADGVAPGATGVVGDPRLVERMLVNLLRNAVGAGARRIDVEAAEDGDRAIVRVLDDGHGFPDAFLERAFERFSRADTARPRGGTGLGLAIVRSLAAAQGGAAGAANREGGGAVVWFTVPRASG